MNSATPDSKVALLSPLGPAGIAVLQLTGSGAADTLISVFHNPVRKLIAISSRSGKIYHGYIVDADGRRVDEVLVCPRELPENSGSVIDVCCHGGVRPAQKVMEVLIQAGAKPAQAKDLPNGGFAGLIDVTNPTYRGLTSEVLSHLSKAATRRVVQILLYQLQDGLAGQINHLLAPQIAKADLLREIDRLLASWPLGRRLTNPARIAIIGPVNAGKSSLTNMLSGQPGSIVTSQAGTTRDWVSQQVSLGGLPVILIDTAGHRPPVDTLEAEGIRRAVEQAQQADMRLLVLDGTNPDGELPELLTDPGTVVAVNKADLPGYSAQVLPPALANCSHVETSAVTSLGRSDLTKALLKALNCQDIGKVSAVVFTQRQATCLQNTAEALSSQDTESVALARDTLRQCLAG